METTPQRSRTVVLAGEGLQKCRVPSPEVDYWTDPYQSMEEKIMTEAR